MAYPQQGTQTRNGFAVPIGPDTQLGAAMLIAEYGDGTYQPIGAVATINEARELAEDDMRVRMGELETGTTPPSPRSTWSGRAVSTACTALPIESNRSEWGRTSAFSRAAEFNPGGFSRLIPTFASASAPRKRNDISTYR